MTMTRNEALKLMVELRASLEKEVDDTPVTKEEVFAALYHPQHWLYQMFDSETGEY